MAEKKMSLSRKRRVFVLEYIKDFNATQAAIRAGYSGRSAYTQGPRLLDNVEVKAAIDKHIASREEVLIGLTEQARSDIGEFFKIVDEWTDYEPLPTYEVLGAEKRTIPKGENETEEKTFYFVRHITIDLDKLKDPKYSQLIAEFSDSPRDGLTIKPYNKQAALEKLGRYHKLFTDKTEISGAGGGELTVHIVTDNKEIEEK